MRIELVRNENTLTEICNEFLLRKKADGLRDRTLKDYAYHLPKFIATTSNSLDEKQLRKEVVNYFAAIPDTSAAIYNKPYSYTTVKCLFACLPINMDSSRHYGISGGVHHLVE